MPQQRCAGRLTSTRFLRSTATARTRESAAAAWTMPTLLMYAGADRCVAPAGSAAFAAAAPSATVRTRRFERLFHEILNEPEFKDAYRWYGVEAKLAAAIRRAAPRHTIIATGARWDNDEDLVFLEPLPDPNVIYVFHFYEPHIFTHQGATWGAYYWHWLKGLHYPSSPENAAQVAATVPEAVNRLYVIRYGQDHWDAARVEADPRSECRASECGGHPEALRQGCG